MICQNALYLTRNLAFHFHTKYIDIHFYFVYDSWGWLGVIIKKLYRCKYNEYDDKAYDSKEVQFV